MNKEVSKQKNNSFITKCICNNMGQGVPGVPQYVDNLFLTKNYLPQNRNRMIMPYEIFSKKHYNM